MATLTNNGLIVYDNDKTCFMADIKKAIRNGNTGGRKIYFDERRNGFVIDHITDDYIFIKLNDDQMFKYKNGISDPVVDQLRDLEKFYEENKNKDEMIESALNGDLPSDKKSISIYSGYLNLDILKTGATILRNAVLVSLPTLMTIDSFVRLITSLFNENIPQLLISLGEMFIGLIAIAVQFVEYSDETTLAIKNFKEYFNRIKANLIRKKDLTDHIKHLKAIEKGANNEEFDFQSFVNDEKIKEEQRAVEFSDAFLNEIKEILDLTKQLPKEEQDDYALKILAIIEYYKEKRLNIMTTESKLVYGEVADVNILVSELRPKLNTMRFEIEEKIRKQNDIDKFVEQCDTLAECTKSSYDEWSDDLNGSGYATQKMA